MSSDLVAGTRIQAADFPVAGWDIDGSGQFDITNTGYATGTPVVDTTFVAPTSGRVLLIVGGGARDNAASSGRASIAPQVFEGTDATGTEIVTPNASLRGVITADTADRFCRWSRITLLEGLTPETTYYARIVYRLTDGTTGSGSVDVADRGIGVMPVP